MLNNQLSSSQINETLLNAMKTIAQKEVQNLEFDVTEKCTIIRKDKDKNKEDCYIIRCNGVEWEAYESNGIEYYKNDDMYCYLMRYDGHIKPTFIDKGNVLYHKLI